MRLNNLKIRTKLIIIYITCVLLPMLATNLFVIVSINRTARQEQLRDMQIMCERIEYKINESINQVISVSDYLYMDENLHSFLTAEYEDAISYYESFNQLMEKNEIQYYYTAQSVYNILIGTENKTITNGTYFVKKSGIGTEPWYQAFQNNGEDLLLYPYYEQNQYLINTGHPYHIAIIRPLDYYGGNDIMKIEMDATALLNSIQNEGAGYDIYLCDTEKILLTTVQQENHTKDFLSLSSYKKKDLEQEKNMSVLGKEWTIRVTTSQNSLVTGLKDNQIGLVLLMCFNVIIPTLVLIFMNRSFQKRISLTEEYIQKVEQGTFEEIVCHEGGDEIGNLIRSYNLMVVKIRELIEVVFKKDKEQQEMKIARKEAELKALQSQINPHFMFNVLESIRMHSFLRNERQTAEVLGKFAILMRSAIKWDKDFVTIEEESNYVRAYLEIQKNRFGDRLDYSVSVQDTCMEREIPKFTIFNFVENACVHGIEKSMQGGNITVLVSCDTEHMFIEVMDSGDGMTPEQLNQVKEKIAGASMEEIGVSTSIGILNTVVRLQMYYEGKVEIMIDSTQGKGTEICVMLPLYGSQKQVEKKGQDMHD